MTHGAIHRFGQPPRCRAGEMHLLYRQRPQQRGKIRFAYRSVEIFDFLLLLEGNDMIAFKGSEALNEVELPMRMTRS